MTNLMTGGPYFTSVCLTFFSYTTFSLMYLIFGLTHFGRLMHQDTAKRA